MAMLLLAALALRAGLGPVGWLAGGLCAAAVNGLLFRALTQPSVALRLTPADGVTLLRATLVAGVTALVADSFVQPVAAPVLVGLAACALALDALDGWVARRTHCVTRLGARFDMEVDAWLILVLSVYAWPLIGAWVLAIGAARYALALAAWGLPWLRRDAPARYWNKVVAAIQGVALTVVAAQVLPTWGARALLVAAAALLAESFGNQVTWLWRHRPGCRVPAAVRFARSPVPPPLLGTCLAGLILWFVLVMPDRVELLTSPVWLSLPAEWLFIAVLAWVLPAALLRWTAGALGIALTLLLLVKLLDMGFFEAFDRSVDLLTDGAYVGSAIGLLQDTVGRATAWVVLAPLVALIAAAAWLLSWSTVRLMRGLRRGRRAVSVRVVGALAALWVMVAVAGVAVPGAPQPVASHGASTLAWAQGQALRQGAADRRVFAAQILQDPVPDSLGAGLLAHLRGKDVLLVFVESYGRAAIRGASFSSGVERVLRAGTRDLRAHGYAARSAFLESPTFGGLSWLAHATLESGLWVHTQQRYDQLLASHRTTLASLFRRAGWRAVADVPADTRSWPQGLMFYHFQKLYNAHNVGYQGPKFSYATMPDQYTLGALYRLELSKAPRAPVFAEIDLVSSHHPWTPLPHLVPWDQLGDGHVFDPMPALGLSPAEAARSSGTVRALYGKSIEYSLQALFSFLIEYPDPDRVVIVLGDHQPWEVVSGRHAGHEVPAALISPDPTVLARVADWGWQDGLLPADGAPVWPMSAFRDRFLTAFSGGR